VRDTGLADRIRAKGVRVVEVAGWQDNGYSFPTAPRGAGHHHTAGAALGVAPSLRICIDGRPDVPGPLCNALQSREPNPWDDTAYVIAAGKANHGGVGTWSGGSGTVDSNYESMGLEVEHTGMTTVDPIRHEISARILAAMLECPGGSRDASMVWEHFEYGRPLGRKVDFRYLAPYNADWVRNRAAFWVGRTTIGDWFDMADRQDLLDALAEHDRHKLIVPNHVSADPDDAMSMAEAAGYNHEAGYWAFVAGAKLPMICNTNEAPTYWYATVPFAYRAGPFTRDESVDLITRELACRHHSTDWGWPAYAIPQWVMDATELVYEHLPIPDEPAG
jgi:hypothetical protein